MYLGPEYEKAIRNLLLVIAKLIIFYRFVVEDVTSVQLMPM
jgi:hypothetical protein